MKQTGNPPEVLLELLVVFMRTRRGWPRNADLRRRWLIDLWRDDNESFGYFAAQMDRAVIHGRIAA